jgi:hypothetical protein
LEGLSATQATFLQDDNWDNSSRVSIQGLEIAQSGDNYNEKDIT